VRVHSGCNSVMFYEISLFVSLLAYNAAQRLPLEEIQPLEKKNVMAKTSGNVGKHKIRTDAYTDRYTVWTEKSVI